jgi:hypothetical protein
MDLREFTAWLDRTRQIDVKVAQYGFDGWAPDHEKRGDASNWEEFIEFVSGSFEDISKPTTNKMIIQGMQTNHSSFLGKILLRIS